MRHLVLAISVVFCMGITGCAAMEKTRIVVPNHVETHKSTVPGAHSPKSEKVNKREWTLLSEFSTILRAGTAKVNNVKLATESINGHILVPGEEFSYNQVVGNRTADKGYREAPSFLNGKKSKSIGGGVCQLSSTVHGAAVKAKLMVTERHRHSLPVHYPSWAEATVSYGSKDMKFINNTGRYIKIIARVTHIDRQKIVVVQIWVK